MGILREKLQMNSNLNPVKSSVCFNVQSASSDESLNSDKISKKKERERMLPKRTLSAKSNLSLLSANSKNSRNTNKSSNSHLSIQECASNLSNLSHLTNLDVTEMKTEISDKVYAKLKAFYKEKQQKLLGNNTHCFKANQK